MHVGTGKNKKPLMKETDSDWDPRRVLHIFLRANLRQNILATVDAQLTSFITFCRPENCQFVSRILISGEKLTPLQK